jgi:hypothetical protein
MKKNVFWLIMVLGWVILAGITTRKALAYNQVDSRTVAWYVRSQLPNITPVPTDTPAIVLVETPADRVLPPVGSNASLVVSASLLVLIIIGGVLGARRRVKH